MEVFPDVVWCPALLRSLNKKSFITVPHYTNWSFTAAWVNLLKKGKGTVKFRKRALGFIFFRGPFRGLIFGGAYFRFKIDWASLIVGSKFTVFTLFYFVFEGNFLSTSPPRGPYIWIAVWGAYIWRGFIFSEILRYITHQNYSFLYAVECLRGKHSFVLAHVVLHNH